MLVLCCISGVIVSYYVYLILQFKQSIADQIPIRCDTLKQQKISVIIPFRNEEKHLKEALYSLSKVAYPHDSFEIIFVNDHSIDSSLKVFEDFEKLPNLRIIDNQGAGKKSAILSGIGVAKHEWILVSDADCLYGEQWITVCDQLIRSKVVDMFVLPVSVKKGSGILADYQYLESLSMIGVNAGYYFKNGNVLLASGANLLYKKDVFNEVNPYAENIAIASGDDMFLLEKFKRAKRKIELVIDTNSWVYTHSESTWSAVLSQRVRWAKKMHHFKFQAAFYYGAFILLTQLSLWLLLLISFKNLVLIPFFIIAIILKSLADHQLINEVSIIKKRKIRWSTILLHEFLYMLMLPVIMVLTLITRPKWKERKIRS